MSSYTQSVAEGAARQHVSWCASGNVTVARGVGVASTLIQGMRAVLVWQRRQLQLQLRPSFVIINKWWCIGCCGDCVYCDQQRQPGFCQNSSGVNVLHVFLWYARVFGALQAFAPEAARYLPALLPSRVAIGLTFCLVANSACMVAGGFFWWLTWRLVKKLGAMA